MCRARVEGDPRTGCLRSLTEASPADAASARTRRRHRSRPLSRRQNGAEHEQGKEVAETIAPGTRSTASSRGTVTGWVRLQTANSSNVRLRVRHCSTIGYPVPISLRLCCAFAVHSRAMASGSRFQVELDLVVEVLLETAAAEQHLHAPPEFTEQRRESVHRQTSSTRKTAPKTY